MIKLIARAYVFTIAAVTALAAIAAVLHVLAAVAALVFPAYFNVPAALSFLGGPEAVCYSLLLIPALLVYGAALDAAR